MPKSQDRVPADDAILMIGQAQAEGFGLLTILGVEGEGQGEEQRRWATSASLISSICTAVSLPAGLEDRPGKRRYTAPPFGRG